MPRGTKKWWYFWPLVLNLMKTTNRSLSGLYPCPATDISSCGFDSTVSLLSGIGNHKTQAPMQKAHPDCGSFPRFLKALPTWAKDETDPTVCFWRGWGGSNLITKGNCPNFFFFVMNSRVVLAQLITIVLNVSENSLHGSDRTIYQNYSLELQKDTVWSVRGTVWKGLWWSMPSSCAASFRNDASHGTLKQSGTLKRN